MTDNDLENIYKQALQVSHYAGLRAVYDLGYDQGAGVSVSASQGDPSLTQVAPSTDPTAQNIATP